MIRKFMVAAAAALMLMGCTTTDQITGERTTNRTANGAIIGAIAGAALGTAAGGDDGRNAAIGAVVGGLAGAGVGRYMDSQYQNLRQRLAGTGVGVTRISESEILLNFPADLTFDFNRDTVKGQFVPTLSNTAQVLSQYPETNVVGHRPRRLGWPGCLQPRPLRAPRAFGWTNPRPRRRRVWPLVDQWRWRTFADRRQLDG